MAKSSVENKGEKKKSYQKRNRDRNLRKTLQNAIREERDAGNSRKKLKFMRNKMEKAFREITIRNTLTSLPSVMHPHQVLCKISLIKNGED